jgi:hypothetical protein
VARRQIGNAFTSLTACVPGGSVPPVWSVQAVIGEAELRGRSLSPPPIGRPHSRRPRSGKIRKHIPDYFLATDHGPVVIDVKPEHLLTKPTVAYTFAWTRRLVEARGWQYEVWSGSRLRSWRTCGSLLATGVPGCSTRPCLTKSAAPRWRAARWGKCCVAWTAMIQRLERDIGGSLLERAERGRPMTPTALGEQVLAALHRTSQPGG